MKVRCVKLLDIDGEATEKYSSLKVGQAYSVLAIDCNGDGKILLRMISEDPDTPALFDVRQFEVVDSGIPPNWVISIEEETLSIGPTAWMRPGFWEDFFDQKIDALEEFEKEL